MGVCKKCGAEVADNEMQTIEEEGEQKQVCKNCAGQGAEAQEEKPAEGQAEAQEESGEDQA